MREIQKRKKLGIWTRAAKASFSNREQEMEEKHNIFKIWEKKTDTLFKENVKSNKNKSPGQKKNKNKKSRKLWKDQI